MKTKIVIGAVLLTLLGNLLCLPFWTKYDWKSLIDTYRNREARLDITYTGKITAADPVNISCNIKCPTPGKTWSGNKSRAIWTEFPIHERWQQISFIITPIYNGKIDIKLRGPVILWGPFKHRDGDKEHPVLVDFRNLEVDGEAIFSDVRVFCYDNFFKMSRSISTGKPIVLSFEVRRHHFNRNDLDISGKILFAITGNIFGFLFFCKFLHWFRRRKTIQGWGIDRVFLVLFFTSLFFPMSNISEATKDFRENRTLADKPNIFEIFHEESEFSKRYDNWYNDHFGSRDSLLKIYHFINFNLNSVPRSSRAAYFKNNGWLFLPPFAHSRGIVKPVVESLVNFNKFCKKSKIKFYYIEVPDKQFIYQEYLYKFGFDKRGWQMVEKVHQEVRDKVRSHNIPYIYPFKELRDASVRDYVYFKWTAHWTDLGAYIGYRELMKEVKKDFPDIPVVSLDDYKKTRSKGIRDEWNRDYHTGELSFFALKKDDKRDTDYIYYDHRQENLLNLNVAKYTKDATYAAGRYRIMLIGSSQCENFFQFLPYSGKTTKYVRINMALVKKTERYKIMKLYQKMILDFKPDILIFLDASNRLPQVSNFFNN